MKVKCTFVLILWFLAMSFSVCYSQPPDTLNNSTRNFVSAFFENQVFAHRGGYAKGPENTIETIMLSLHNKVTCVEIDVRLTKDKQLVLFHDETIERVLQTDKKIKISEITLAELKAIPLRDTRLGTVYISTFQDLADSLVKVIPSLNINFILELDWKPHGNDCESAIDELSKIVDEKTKVIGARLYEHFFLSTFYPDVLKYASKKVPQIVRAFAVIDSPDKGKLKAKLAVLLANHFIKKYKASIIEPSLCMVTERFVNKWHKRKILINAYTANSACEKEHLKKLKVAFTTNCPVGTCENDASDQMNDAKNWCKNCKELTAKK